MRSSRITTDVATVECHKQVRCWRLLRTIMELLIPTCSNNNNNNNNNRNYKPNKNSITYPNLTYSPSFTSSAIFTGTIFGSKRGKVKLCVQQSDNTILLLELAVPTSALAREMRGGLLRIALECTNNTATQSLPLFDTPVWRMYCNGRRVGFAVKRRPSKADMAVLRKMSGVVVGAGVVSWEDVGCQGDDIMYMRAYFHRVRGSSNAESFHFIDPDGNSNQDLSIFFLRSS